MEETRIFGFTPSQMDGTEHIFGEGIDFSALPKQYSYERHLPSVINQGSNPICIPCSLSAYLNWKENLKTGSKKDNKVNYFEIYNSKTTKGDGMSFKEALHFLRHKGVKSDAGKLGINEYAKITNALSLKAAIVMNGPCVGGLIVKNYSDEFWKGEGGSKGGHAVAIVGYDENGFIIRNSWGSSFGKKGYTYLKNDDLNYFVEIWTIVQ